MAALLCFGCAGESQARQPPPPRNLGDALALAACPMQVAEANAWINRMPPVGERTATIHVSIRLADPEATAVLTRSARTRADVLVLDLRAADDAPIPGRAAYREASPAQPYSRVELDCRGATIHRIPEVETVY